MRFGLSIQANLVANASKLMASRLFVAALGWAGTLLIARRLSAGHDVTPWGDYSFVFSFLALMVIFTNVVSGRVAVRGLLDAEDKGTYAGSYVLLRLLLGIVGYLLAIAIVVLGGYPPDVVRATLVAGMAIVLATPSMGYDAIFQIEGRLGTVAVANAIGQVAQLGLTVALALIGASMVEFTIPAVVFEVVTLVWKLGALRSILRIRYTIVLRNWVALLRAGIPYAIGGALATVYYSIDSVMLSKMTSFRAVGIYAIPYKFAGIINFIPLALGAALLAPLVRAWPSQPPVFWTTLRKAIVFLTVLAVPIAVEFFLFASPIIRLLYGQTFVESGTATRVVVASSCIGFFTTLGVTTLVALDRNILYPLAALVGVVVNVALNLVMIPRYSYNGAAVDTLLTEVVVLALLWIPLLRMKRPVPLPLAVIGKAGLAGILSATVGALTVRFAPWPVAATVSGMVYFGLVHFAGVLGPGGIRDLIRDDLVVTGSPGTGTTPR